MNKKRSGFTLIELLAVIVILAIIALIATPLILYTIEESKKGSFRASVLNSFDAVDYYLLENRQSYIDDEILILDLAIKNKDQFKSGRFIENQDGEIEADLITDGVYCANGPKTKLIVIKGCGTLDKTPPINARVSLLNKTSSSIEVIGSGEDIESGILKYEFKLDDGLWVDNGLELIYKFENVSSGRHTISLRVTNKVGLEAEATLEVILELVEAPTYIIDNTDWAKSKVVTVNYPETVYEGLIHSYSIDNGDSWTIVDGDTIDVVFSDDGIIIGKIDDGSTMITSSYTVDKIDNELPTIVFGTNGNSNYTGSQSTKVNISDLKSGVDKAYYIWNTSTSEPLSSSFTMTFIDGQTLSNSSNGSYYLWVKVVDKAGNEIIARTNAFNVDNTPPSLGSSSFFVTSVTHNSKDYGAAAFTIRIYYPETITDSQSGLPSSPILIEYKHANNTEWILACQNSLSNTNCDIENLSNMAQYHYRMCVIDRVGNKNCLGYEIIDFKEMRRD